MDFWRRLQHGWTLRTLSPVKQTSHEGINIVCFHLCVSSQYGRGRGWRVFNGGRDSVWKEKNMWGWRVVMLHSHVKGQIPASSAFRCLRRSVPCSLSPQLRKRCREVGTWAKVSEQGQGRAWHPSPAEWSPQQPPFTGQAGLGWGPVGHRTRLGLSEAQGPARGWAPCLPRTGLSLHAPGDPAQSHWAAKAGTRNEGVPRPGQGGLPAALWVWGD